MKFSSLIIVMRYAQSCILGTRRECLYADGFCCGAAGDAREKTSELVTLGLIDRERRLTEVGHRLLEYSESNNFAADNF